MLRQGVERGEVSDDAQGGERDRIGTISAARREAAAIYWEWKKGRRPIKPHEMAIVVSALSNIAGMIEKERQDELQAVRAELAELKAEVEAFKAARPQTGGAACAGQTQTSPLN